MNEWDQPDADVQLGRDLHDLGERLRFPPTPVFHMPRPAPSAPSRALNPHLANAWRVGLVIGALLLILLAIPDVRHAAADLVGFPGIRIEFGNRSDDPPPTVSSIGGALLLGTATDLDVARAETGLPALMPTANQIQTPPEVYVNKFQGVQMVSLLYPPSDPLAEIGSTGVGLLLMAIDDGGNTSMLITKRATGETPPQSVTVNGHDGIWIEGGVLSVEGGDPFWTYQRRSGNVLVWEQDGITYRMESALSRDEAIALADSFQRGTPDG